VAFALSLWKIPIHPYIYSIIDMLFIPACIAFLAPPLLTAKKIKNIQFLFVLSLLSLGNLFMHLAALEIMDFDFASKGVYLGVNLILLILIIISGRIIPFFTMNSMPHIKIKKNEIIDYLTIFSVCAFIFLDLIEKESSYSAWTALCAFALNLARMLGWKSWKLKGSPLLWILHLGYLWIVIGFLLVFLSDKFALLPRSVAIHAFTAGAMGTFIIGMMSRVSLGHTGRPLKLSKGFVISYLFITLSGIIRVGSTFFPDFYSDGILLSGFCWVLSFVIFLAYYSSILISPRPDGKPG
jgi:uncharacterized protein involved in response to NO